MNDNNEWLLRIMWMVLTKVMADISGTIRKVIERARVHVNVSSGKILDLSLHTKLDTSW